MLEILGIIGAMATHAATQNWPLVIEDAVSLIKAVYALAHPGQQPAIAARIAALGVTEPLE